MQLGHYKEWSWLTTNKMYIADVLKAYPNLVINKHVLITSYDSGLVILDEKKLQSGWTYSGHVCHPHEFAKEAEPDRQFALSPRVADPQILPLDMYDEWYVFENPPKINELLVYVNYEFRLSLGHMGLYALRARNRVQVAQAARAENLSLHELKPSD